MDSKKYTTSRYQALQSGNKKVNTESECFARSADMLPILIDINLTDSLHVSMPIIQCIFFLMMINTVLVFHEKVTYTPCTITLHSATVTV